MSDLFAPQLIATIHVGGDPQHMALAPDGRYVYVIGDSAEVSVIDTETNAVVRTISIDTPPWNLAVTPDGRYVYVTHRALDKVSVIDTTTGVVVATVPVGGTIPPVAYSEGRGVAIAPNGRLVYVTHPDLGTAVIDTTTNA